MSVMYLFTTLIENLGDPMCFAKFMTQSIKVHHKRGVDLAQYQVVMRSVVRGVVRGVVRTVVWAGLRLNIVIMAWLGACTWSIIR